MNKKENETNTDTVPLFHWRKKNKIKEGRASKQKREREKEILQAQNLTHRREQVKRTKTKNNFEKLNQSMKSHQKITTKSTFQIHVVQ